MLELRVWIDDKRDRLRENIFKAFNSANIQMPYVTIQLVLFNFEVRNDNMKSELN